MEMGGDAVRGAARARFANKHSIMLTNEIGHYLGGISVSTGSASGRTWITKQSLPDDFDAIQIVLHHNDSSATTAYSATVAATETADTSTANNRFRPIVGGAEQNLLDSASSKYGWRSVKWSGASTVTPAGAAASTKPTVVFSDWVELSSVPRADGGTLPLIMLRLWANGGASSFFTTAAATQTTGTENGNFIAQGVWFADASGVYATDPQSNHPSDALNNSHPTVGFRIRSRKLGITLMCIGDSITQCNTTSTKKVSWGLTAASTVTSAGIPCGFVNYGASSQDMDRYWTDVAKPQVANWKPTIAAFSAWTPNFGAYASVAAAQRKVQRMGALTADFIATCISNRVMPAVANGVPCSAAIIASADIDAVRIEYANKLITDANRSGAILMDWNSLINDGASPNRIPSALQYDTTHPNDAGIALQAGQLSAQIMARAVL